MKTPVGHDAHIATLPSELHGPPELHGPSEFPGPSEFHEKEFRRTMGLFCTGVTVITTCDPGPVGFTCQSFASLSLDPPLVTISAANTSRTLPRVLRSGSFSVNILSAGQEELGLRFASSHPDRFAGVGWRPSPATGTPHLAGALAWVDAEVHSTVPGGDHTIVIGRVRAVRGEGEDPLLYFGGAFCARGELPAR
ncbi:flavin reductase family protein [Streptomyces sp. NRRL B-24572]|uniref:flavin reductase family protein n=1 Tax=Streptomyces sp. NRRL B-24572 TaxID=1962156 RepID=UPI000A394045|nr:flavin reductase family protein [Streptomyces sp. NRRL B-24572]